MATSRLDWHGHEFMDYVHQLMAQRLDKAARFAHNKMKEKVSLAGTGYASVAHEREEIAGQFRTGKLFTKMVHYRRKRRIYGFVRSKPGEPPRKQIGLLRRSIAYETDAPTLTARVGVGGPPVAPGRAYAVYLELGTSKMSPRPYLRTTMWEQADNIRRILEGDTATTVTGVSTFGEEGPVGPGVNLADAVANVGKVPLSGVQAP